MYRFNSVDLISGFTHIIGIFKVEEELMAVLDTKKVHSIAYLRNLYIKYESDLLQISADACIFNCPRLHIVLSID